ncbi:selenophosphate synthase [Thalassovita litoralis]|uniref:Selenophosphate synthase n=1 Tax=Thalassovita litoralis TaxID=1010611 RepID=A0A521FJW8_9RHOB|nr:selenide, water dikinase SelD [Thalassovita litoralis]SMO96416.1 selenophosphate synthase [Thalassovita litoralis]
MHVQIPLTRDLVLIGGGHSHALLLLKWGMRPLPGTRVTVINPGPTAPYSGMLPGHIAGHYTREDLEIDLVRLARFAGARVILGRAVGLDAQTKTVTLDDGRVIEYDVASVDVGITSELPQIPGFSQYAIGAKPLDRYAECWADFIATAHQTGQAGPVAVIGGGVAGVELAMAMSFALRRATGASDVTVIEAAATILSADPKPREKLLQSLEENGVKICKSSVISEITPDGPKLTTGQIIPASLTIGVTGALPQAWLAQTGLPLTDGFINVEKTLQVQGQDDLFAVGDCAHLMHAPRPKAGVYAVRAAPVLYDNLCARLTGQDLRPFRPQKDYLKLISLGQTSALAEKWGRIWQGPWLWRLKDRIDRKFMRMFHDLPQMPQPDLPPVLTQGVRDELGDGQPICGGCGSKVGAGTLSGALASLPAPTRADVITGRGDDAAVLRIRSQHQVLTTDHLKAFTEDPALMARITAVHALGDIWAMGAKPQAVLASVILPRMSPALQARTMRDIMGAASDVFTSVGAEIVGGHSTQGPEMTIGYTITGLVDQAITHAGAQVGDVLILTRPLGTGVLLAAEMQARANGRHVAKMLAAMAEPQDKAARILHMAHAMTDVTGFGLAGHLQAICQASGVGADLDLSHIPVYEGAIDMSQSGIKSTLYNANLMNAPIIGLHGPKAALLHDPQTAGGLLAAVPAAHAPQILADLQQLGLPATQIGRIVEGPPMIRCL